MPAAVHVHLQLRIVGDDGTVFTDSEILRLEKSGWKLLACRSARANPCRSACSSRSSPPRLRQPAPLLSGRQLCHKGKYPIIFRTVFGNVTLPSPRFYRCDCHPADSQTFSPLTELFTEHTAPETCANSSET